MEVKEFGSSAFRMLEVRLSQGELIIAEPGSMASQSAGLISETKLNGTFISAILMKFLGRESFFINYYKNKTQSEQKLFLTQTTPGDIQEVQINGNEIFIESGSFIARTEGVLVQVRWAGFSSLLAGEGLFKLAFTGQGRVWYGCYGAVVEKEIVGDYIVDSGHLLMWPATISLKIKFSGGILSSFLSKEGLVLQLKGHGKIQMQTRSVKGLAQWLNARFWS